MMNETTEAKALEFKKSNVASSIGSTGDSNIIEESKAEPGHLKCAILQQADSLTEDQLKVENIKIYIAEENLEMISIMTLAWTPVYDSTTYYKIVSDSLLVSENKTQLIMNLLIHLEEMFRRHNAADDIELFKRLNQVQKILINICQRFIAPVTEVKDTLLLSQLIEGSSVQLLPALCHAFKIIPDGRLKESLLDTASKNIDTNWYVECIKLIMLCGTEKDHLKTCIDKLLNEKNLTLALKYVADDREMRLFLVYEVEARCGECLQSKNVSSSSPVKSFAKRMYTLASKWDIPKGKTENIQTYLQLGSMRYLNHSRRQATGDRENWTELIEMLCLQYPKLCSYLLHEQAKYKDEESYVYFVKSLNIPGEISDPIYHSVDWSAQYEPLEDTSKKPNKQRPASDPLDFVTLSVPFTFASTIEELDWCKQKLLKSSIVGLDMEWTPSFFGESEIQCCIVQMSTEDHVYILDSLALPPSIFEEFFVAIVTNTSTTVLACGVSQDDIMCKRLFSSLDKGLSHYTTDIGDVQKKIFRLTQDIKDDARGISTMTKRYFTKDIDKTNQISNWKRRPLRQAQLNYAALDAHILVLLYKKMVLKLQDLERTANLGSDSEQKLEVSAKDGISKKIRLDE